MITDVDQVGNESRRLAARYFRWERRHAARFVSWPVGRRWSVFVLLPALLICCGGTVFGVPLAWVLRGAVEAGRGAPSPDAAADSYLMALGYNSEDGLLPLLDNDRQDELLGQWRAYREAMNGTTPPPAKLEYGSLTVGPVVHDLADVTTDVSATWWNVDGRALAYSSKAYSWQFRTREDDNGWHVLSVTAPDWCGGYVRLDH